MNYKSNKVPDTQYKDLVAKVLVSRQGLPITDQGLSTTSVVGAQMRYDLTNGIPLITERSLSIKGKGKIPLWLQGISELCAFINGVTTVEGLHKFGCYFWDIWGEPDFCAKNNLPPGNLGNIYGHVWRDFDGVDQIDRLIKRLRHNPYGKTHLVTAWHPGEVETPDFGHTMSCRPCHGSFQVVRLQNHVTGRDVLHLHLTQRAGDLPVGVPFNQFQYAVLLLMLAQVLDCEAGEFIITISDCHIYGNQIEAMNELITRETRTFPEVILDPSIKDIFAFRSEHVQLVEGTYNPHPPIRLEVLL